MTQYIPFWRRKFYVHPIQRKYFHLALVPLIVCGFLLVILVFAPVFWAVKGPAPDLDTATALGQIYGMGGIRIWLAVFLSMLAACLLSFLATNKFAGPLYRIEQILRKVEEGELPVSVRIRRDDDIHEFAQALDSAFKTIAVALTAIRDQQAKADEQLVALQRRARADFNGDILNGLEGIGRSHREVEQILAGFHIPKPADPGAGNS